MDEKLARLPGESDFEYAMRTGQSLLSVKMNIRKKETQDKRIHLSLTESNYNKLKRASREAGVSMNSLINQMIDNLL